MLRTVKEIKNVRDIFKVWEKYVEICSKYVHVCLIITKCDAGQPAKENYSIVHITVLIFIFNSLIVCYTHLWRYFFKYSYC